MLPRVSTLLLSCCIMAGMILKGASFVTGAARIASLQTVSAVHKSTSVTFGRRLTTVAMAGDMESFVQKTISGSPVVVFSKTYCPYCTKAKETLTKEGAKFEVVELDKRKDGDAIQLALFKLTGRRTVPNVFVGGKTIGGGDDTKALSDAGKLKGMLKEVRAL